MEDILMDKERIRRLILFIVTWFASGATIDGMRLDDPVLILIGAIFIIIAGILL
jgi:hypothetical protein